MASKSVDSRDAPRYKPGSYQFDEAEAEAFAASCEPVDILLLHCGGLGLLDDADPGDPGHTGSAAIRSYFTDARDGAILRGGARPSRVHGEVVR